MCQGESGIIGGGAYKRGGGGDTVFITFNFGNSPFSLEFIIINTNFAGVKKLETLDYLN